MDGWMNLLINTHLDILFLEYFLRENAFYKV